MASATIDDEVATLLRSADQRYTTGRRRLIAVLESSGKPLTISQILAADSALVQSSAYRNLTILELAGAVTRIVTSDEFARYELAEQLTEHHHHLICTSCGDVIDFALSRQAESNLDSLFRKAAAKASFTVVAHRLDLIGVCQRCQDAAAQ